MCLTRIALLEEMYVRICEERMSLRGHVLQSIVSAAEPEDQKSGQWASRLLITYALTSVIPFQYWEEKAVE
jgi:hypothetical protein